MSKEPELISKRVFLIVSASESQRSLYAKWINEHISNSTIFMAVDGSEAHFKLNNRPPHVLITDWDLPKLTGQELVELILEDKALPDMSVIISSAAPDTEHFVDEVVTQKVQFLHERDSDWKFSRCLTQALNRLEKAAGMEYRLHFLNKDETLFREGGVPDYVYIVRKGKLQAQARRDSGITVLGDIQTGEFVGEMAHINHEARSATVVALENCELIAIPMGTLDLVLFSKPAWSQALVRTLSKRLKQTNEVLVEKSTK